MTEERLVEERLRMLPPIRRARLWRLYAESQSAGRTNRFLDFWMDGGRSILGAKGTGLGTAAKAAVDMGLTRPFPSVREARLEKSALKAYPGYAAVRLYRSEERARAAAASVSPNAPPKVIKPFAEHLEAASPAVPRSTIALPLLPCPAALSPAILLFGKESDAKSVDDAGMEGELLPPLLLECGHRALCELEKFRLTYKEELWKRTDRRLKGFFERRGPYLFPRCEESSYGKLFEAALGAGILLSPAFEEPSIIPGDFDDGELAHLATALAVAQGELA
jgi:hypothetical protein